MNICILQHVSFEGAGTILPYFEGSQHRVKMIHLYDGELLPSSKWPDLLIIMGGPMGVNDEAQFSWLAEEKAFINAVIQSGTWVMGVCLGAQLIAQVLGANVTKNSTPEIGWYPVTMSPEMDGHWLQGILGAEFCCLHWHADTFAIPEGAVALGSSEACANQGFLYQGRVLGLQFHLEFTHESTTRLIERCPADLVDSPWVQTPERMLCSDQAFANANAMMSKILAHIEEQIVSQVSLHPQLAQDCILLDETQDIWVLLNSNASIPWFILVPKGPYRELDDLEDGLRSKLFALADQLSDVLRTEFGSEKINIGALGNMVPQLHLHVIGRHSRDPCWPNPVWGNLQDEKAWTTTEIARLRSGLSEALNS